MILPEFRSGAQIAGDYAFVTRLRHMKRLLFTEEAKSIQSEVGSESALRERRSLQKQFYIRRHKI
ncbi:hypothetical protein [Stenotrophomonas sp. S41]|uniref:hypothetical protein n=1 Tax=Stenotrophomonas sp. S41 TaxID=2767464 RepID=UPI0019095F40|nr:hypothetical protein [Stenotrophomonas sp. S41]